MLLPPPRTSVVGGAVTGNYRGPPGLPVTSRRDPLTSVTHRPPVHRSGKPAAHQLLNIPGDRTAEKVLRLGDQPRHDFGKLSRGEQGAQAVPRPAPRFHVPPPDHPPLAHRHTPSVLVTGDVPGGHPQRERAHLAAELPAAHHG